MTVFWLNNAPKVAGLPSETACKECPPMLMTCWRHCLQHVQVDFLAWKGWKYTNSNNPMTFPTGGFWFTAYLEKSSWCTTDSQTCNEDDWNMTDQCASCITQTNCDTLPTRTIPQVQLFKSQQNAICIWYSDNRQTWSHNHDCDDKNFQQSAIVKLQRDLDIYGQTPWQWWPEFLLLGMKPWIINSQAYTRLIQPQQGWREFLNKSAGRFTQRAWTTTMMMTEISRSQQEQSGRRSVLCCRLRRRSAVSPYWIPDPIRSGSNSPSTTQAYIQLSSSLSFIVFPTSAYWRRCKSKDPRHQAFNYHYSFLFPEKVFAPVNLSIYDRFSTSHAGIISQVLLHIYHQWCPRSLPLSDIQCEFNRPPNTAYFDIKVASESLDCRTQNNYLCTANYWHHTAGIIKKTCFQCNKLKWYGHILRKDEIIFCYKGEGIQSRCMP